MGNAQFKCPSDTVNGISPLSCVMPCPESYELRTADGAQRCVSTIDPSASIHLMPLAAVQRKADDTAPFRIDALKGVDDDAYTRYNVERTRFNKERAKADLQVDHQAQIDAAARDVLAAGGNDETANAKYSALTKDPDALNVMYQTQIEKDKNRFIGDYQFLTNQVYQQQQTLDLINNLKDSVFSVKDDMEYSVGTFNKQIGDIRNQININRRIRQQATDYGTWLNTGLNVLIVLALLYLVFTVGRRAFRGVSMQSDTLGAPARPAASDETNAIFGALGKYLASAAPR